MDRSRPGLRMNKPLYLVIHFFYNFFTFFILACLNPQILLAQSLSGYQCIPVAAHAILLYHISVGQ